MQVLLDADILRYEVGFSAERRVKDEEGNVTVFPVEWDRCAEIL